MISFYMLHPTNQVNNRSEHSEHTSEIEQVDGLQPLQSATLDDAAIGLVLITFPPLLPH